MKATSIKISAQRCWLVGGLLGLAVAGPMTQDVSVYAMTSAARTGPAVVLQTFRAGQLVLDLAIATCRQSGCPIEVRLRSGGRVIDRVMLPVAAGSQRATAETTDTLWGTDVSRKAWATGEENDYVSTAARLLRLAPQTTALLVTQRYGFEHLKRNHLLILPRAGKLHIVWKAEEGSGPTWSATEIVRSSRSDRQEVAYFHGFSEPEEDVSERLDVIRLSWNAAAARVRKTPLPAPGAPLYLLDLGTHDTVVRARQARAVNACVSSYWVLEAGRFRAGADGKALIGMLYATRAAAEQAARSVRLCTPGTTARVVTVAKR
jgi:hypothetical protein